MPSIDIKVSRAINQTSANQLCQKLSALLTETLHKPEQYVMVALSQAVMCMSGTDEDAAFCDVRSIGGLQPETNRAISSGVCKLLSEHLSIDPARIYLNFSNVERTNWGYNGSTF